MSAVRVARLPLELVLAALLVSPAWAQAPSVTTTPFPQSPSIVAVEIAEPFAWSAVRAPDGSTVLTGAVPTEALRRSLLSRLGESGTDLMELRADGAPDTFVADALAALDALALTEEGTATISGAEKFLTGTVAASSRLISIRAALAVSGSDPDGWIIEIGATSASPENPATLPARGTDGTPGNETAPEAPAAPRPEPGTTPSPAPAPAALDEAGRACEAGLDAVSDRNDILFRSGSSALADGSDATIDELARLLGSCPSVPVYVEGHTDSQGVAEANLVLSVARAEAVVSALVARGANAETIYAVGYGQTRPIADNDTAEGRAQNRRIVVTLNRPEGVTIP